MENKLPPLPCHPEPHTYRWTDLELRAIKQWGAEVRRQALNDAMRVCMQQAKRWPGNLEKTYATMECVAAIGQAKAG